MKSSIESLEITPGELGLEPCTGSIVITDPNTGQVRAMVSYPGYDNNRLANKMDSDYFAQLNSMTSSPLYNKATQEKTAPGSTYKPLVSVAGLTEGVIGTGTAISCTGIFDKISPIARCWIYPGSHGSLNVVSAIQHSCNDFFYEVGYRLGTSGNEYNDAYGIERLQKYAEEFGLGDTTGLEITESEPKISDSDVVRSSIGQGTNNYTTAGLSRYISAVANGGVVYNLSLFEKTTDVNGKLVKDYEPEIRNQVEGVADIAFAIRIANGYNSTYPSEIGRDIVRYYYGLDEKDEIVTGHAASLGTVVSGD